MKLPRMFYRKALLRSGDSSGGDSFIIYIKFALPSNLGNVSDARLELYFEDADEVREKLPYVTGPIHTLAEGPP